MRGLALRSLCSLRLESILEYIQLPLHKSLTDISAYVRKTGVMGILKVLHSCVLCTREPFNYRNKAPQRFISNNIVITPLFLFYFD